MLPKHGGAAAAAAQRCYQVMVVLLQVDGDATREVASGAAMAG
jgi:hypothetical protein